MPTFFAGTTNKDAMGDFKLADGGIRALFAEAPDTKGGVGVEEDRFGDSETKTIQMMNPPGKRPGA